MVLYHTILPTIIILTLILGGLKTYLISGLTEKQSLLVLLKVTGLTSLLYDMSDLTQQSFDRAQRQYDRQTDESMFRPRKTRKQQEAYDDWLESKADEARDEKLIEQLNNERPLQ